MREAFERAVNEVRRKVEDVYILGFQQMPQGTQAMTLELYSNDGRFTLVAVSTDERAELVKLYVELKGVHGLP